MKKNIIIIIASVIIAAGLGTGSFFGIRSALNSENVKNDVTTTEQNDALQNIDDENDTMTEEKPEAVKISTYIGNGKLLTANDFDFMDLAYILGYARLTGWIFIDDDDNNKEIYQYPEFDCTDKDAFEKNGYYGIPFRGQEKKLYKFLFGEADYDVFFDGAMDPLKELEKYQKNGGTWGFQRMNAENLRIIAEEMFNLDFDKCLERLNKPYDENDDKKTAYVYDGYCYYIKNEESCDDRMIEFIYDSNKQKSDGSYEVTFKARKMRPWATSDESPYYGDVKVECSLKDYNGMRLWSITKVGKA